MIAIVKRAVYLFLEMSLLAGCGGTPEKAGSFAQKAPEMSPFLVEPRFEDAFLAEHLQQKTAELLIDDVDPQGRRSEFDHLITAIAYVETHPLSDHDQDQVNGWFYQKLERINAVFEHRIREVETLPQGCLFFRAAASLAKWMTENLEQYEADVQQYILLTLHDSARLDLERGYRFAKVLVPTFDLFAYDLGQFDNWQDAGYPVDRAVSVATDVVVCPRKPFKRRKPDTFIKAAHCTDAFYDYVLEDEPHRERFARYLIEKGDARIVEVALLNMALEAADASLALLKMLEQDPNTWSTAWQVMYRHAAFRQHDRALVKSAVRMWHKHPSLKGEVLFGLAFFSHRFHSTIDWATLKETWSIDVTEEDFSRYLAQGPIAISLAYVLWDTFTPGWSRADMLTPYLDNWLKDPAVTEYNSQDPDRALRYIIDGMCRERNKGDLEKMRTYIKTRLTANPDEPLAPLIKHTKKKTCAPKPVAEKDAEEGNTLRIIQTED